MFSEKISGKDTERPQLKAMLNYIREGDILHIESISRLARSTKDLLKLVDILNEKGVQLISAKENIDTTTPAGRFVLSVFAALSQLEREQTLQRQAEGIAAAKAAGKFLGRKRITYDRNEFEKLYHIWKRGVITAREAMTRLGLKSNTFYRRVREFESSIESQV